MIAQNPILSVVNPASLNFAACILGSDLIYFYIVFSKSPKYLVCVPGILLLILVSASLFWCGDTDCITPGSDESCGSLICAMLQSQNPSGAQQSSGFSRNDCSCVCHVPTMISHVSDGAVRLYAQGIPASSNIVPVSIPNNLLFRPPIAA